MLKEEIWKPCPSLDRCLASNFGRVMFEPEYKKMPRGGMRKYGGQPRFGVWQKPNNRYIIIYKQKTYKVARLVCEAWHGIPNDKNSVCIHIDEDSTNNRPENLKWGTQKENLNAPGFVAYCKTRTGENSQWARNRRKSC